MKEEDGAARREPVELWQRCLARLENELPSEDFNMLLRPMQGELEAGKLVLRAPNRYARDLVEGRYLERIAELVADFDERAKVQSIEVSVGDREAGKPIRAEERPRRAAGGEEPGRQHLNPLFRFETFVVGKSNEIAQAAAWRVSENPGSEYNPLLLYGGVGLGKTHLMHAIGNALLAKAPDANIVCLRSERFANDMVRGIRTGTVQDIMQRYQEVDALLIDDIQFFANKLRSQEEFFHAFNAVVERGNQIVLTSDRYPREIEGLEERLKTRFVGGLPVEVEPLDLETRVAILQKKAEAAGAEIGTEVAFHIAERIRPNVRELEGALRRVLARAKFTTPSLPVTLDLVRQALADLFAIHNRQMTIDQIQKVVAEYYNIRHSDMLSKRRNRAIARPRQIAMALAKELTNHSLPDIGERFGGRDHTTVMYACEKVAELRKSDADIAEGYKNLYRQLTY